MSALSALLVALQGSVAAPPVVEVMPLLQQSAVLVAGDDVTAGGVGGGVGVLVVIEGRWLVQADFGALWLMGNAWVVRAAAGVQHDARWCPAAWLTLGTLWGDRIERIGADARRPAIPTWALGVRASPLRFGGPSGVVSALEIGAATDFGGGLWLELTVLQAAARW